LRIKHIDEAVGRIIKDVNTTPDVGVNEIPKQAAKFGNKVDKDGRPPTLSSKVKGKSTNVLFNLGMTESTEPRYTAMEWAIIEGGHSLDDIKPQPKKLGRIFTALENVTEALDNPYPFNLQGPDSSHNFAATAQTPNGVLRMDFEAVDYDDFGIDFAVGKSMGKTEAGDEFRVFATVVAMMKQWISVVGIQHVESFDFGANKGEHASDGRARLYARFAKKLADQLGWKLEQSTTANRDTEFFKLTNPDPVPRDDSHWDNLEDNPDLQDHSELEENFADGKKKGKSRPGRVKKSGASCNGSVTALRKRAKKASGEKAKMYHWCANMKSGKKKKKK
jgi:hypothetical protein